MCLTGSGFLPYFVGLTSSIACVMLSILVVWALGLMWALHSNTYTISALQAYTSRALRISLFILNTSYMPLVQTVLGVFSCVTLGDGSYLQNDVSVDCRSHSYLRVYVPLALWWCMVYVIGIPVFFFCTLVAHRVPYLARVREDTEHLRALIDRHNHDGAASRDTFLFIDHASLCSTDVHPTVTDRLWQHYLHKENHLLEENLTKLTVSTHAVEGEAPHLARLRSWGEAQWRYYWEHLVMGISVPDEGNDEEKARNEAKVRLLIEHSRNDLQTPLPALTWHKPFQRKRESDLHAKAVGACSFLFEESRCGAWYYELFELARKVCITGVVRYMRPGSAVQVFCGLLIIFLYVPKRTYERTTDASYRFMQIFTTVNPFVQRQAQVMGYCAALNLFAFLLLATVLTTRSAILTDEAADKTLKDTLASLLLLSIFILPMCTAFVHFIFNVRYLEREKRAAAKVGEDREDDESVAQGDVNAVSSATGDEFKAAPKDWAQVLFASTHISQTTRSGLRSSTSRFSADLDAARQESL